MKTVLHFTRCLFQQQNCVTTKNSRNSESVESAPSLQVALGPENISYTKFVEKGWKQEVKDELPVNVLLNAKDIQLYPEATDRLFYIDREEYELKPIHIRLLPQSVTIFCPKSNT